MDPPCFVRASSASDRAAAATIFSAGSARSGWLELNIDEDSYSKIKSCGSVSVECSGRISSGTRFACGGVITALCEAVSGATEAAFSTGSKFNCVKEVDRSFSDVASGGFGLAETMGANSANNQLNLCRGALSASVGGKGVTVLAVDAVLSERPETVGGDDSR
ncbi:hypothetical protein [Bradyrhizobium sp. McL0615]|uniref:hypothetical protein n=1 Tax=Bradyrhizobium sp. McL0615 TaxID=3415673 RepID=UPI003CF05E01